MRHTEALLIFSKISHGRHSVPPKNAAAGQRMFRAFECGYFRGRVGFHRSDCTSYFARSTPRFVQRFLLLKPGFIFQYDRIPHHCKWFRFRHIGLHFRRLRRGWRHVVKSKRAEKWHCSGVQRRVWMTTGLNEQSKIQEWDRIKKWSGMGFLLVGSSWF